VGSLPFFHKIGCHGNVPGDIEKRGPDRSSAPKTLSFGEKIAKIGAAYPEIIMPFDSPYVISYFCSMLLCLYLAPFPFSYRLYPNFKKSRDRDYAYSRDSCTVVNVHEVGIM